MLQGSKERTLTAKSLCQWTAATTLVAIGSISFLAAHTIENLKKNGDVSVDVQAFRKLGSLSLALDRVEDERMILEENRLVEKTALAGSDPMPSPSLSFSKNIGVFPKKRFFPGKIANSARLAKNSRALTRVVAPADGMTAAERAEIAALERAPDPALEASAMTSIYQRLRFRFHAAVETQAQEERIAKSLRVIDPSRDAENDYPEESIRVASQTPSYEYDEVPELDVEALTPARAFERKTQIAQADAPTPVPVAASEVTDTIASTASATAKPEIFSQDPVPSFEEVIVAKEQPAEKAAPIITSPGLDLVPGMDLLTTQADQALDNQKKDEKVATGPPEQKPAPKSAPPAVLAASPAETTPSFQSAPAESIAQTEKLPEPAPVISPVTAEDLAEYSNDLSSVFGDGYETAETSFEDESDYSAHAEYSAGTKKPSAPAPSIIVGENGSARRAPPPAKAVAGVTRDDKGVTIDWNAKSDLPGGIQVGKPRAGDSVARNDFDASLSKFSFDPNAAPKKSEANAITASQSSALVRASPTPTASAIPEITREKCDTEKLGVEAFNPASEKETVGVCRRPLSLEGSRGDGSHRWWEAYSADATTWPTLIYQRDDDARSEKDRVPLLSSASIRILSALSRTNTHSGMGIVFGEVPRGLEIRMIGRSDAPMYFDAGMKPGAESSTKRNFVFLNVAPGQPLLQISRAGTKVSGAIPLVVKAGIATWIRVPDPVEKTFSFTVFDASSPTEKRLGNMTVDVVGQARMGITDRRGAVRIEKVATFGTYPIYVDVTRDDKSHKNRYRVLPSQDTRPLYFFDEKRASGWIAQLAGGVSPTSGIVVGVLPSSALSPKALVRDATVENHLRIGTFDKKGSLVPERYLLDSNDRLVSESRVEPGKERFLGVQIPEGVSIPSVIDAKGELVWSQIVYAQPGVINVVGP